ncbi:hypothetical protein OHA72_45430 [Dactylosporangium sp. NBC_01737]|uniref:hypothetical protein n=1 Tax=Dactylosporangium sp. NBC_01737 TaxID=2975959 RepID=UPI002E153994|nr:hypothetical protein OHA72_45430 [Dactylosporangium sp. NBC_01737]
MRISTRTALLAVTGNAVVMGVVGVTAPIGWLLVPGIAGMASRPRIAALMSGWAGALILLSVAVPIVPGHRGDRGSLVASAVCLAVMPVLSWQRRTLRVRATATSTIDAGAGGVRRPVVLAVSRLPGEIAVMVPRPGGGVWAMIGLVMGQVADPVRCAEVVERAFRAAARRGGAGLEQLPVLLTPLVRRYAPHGYAVGTFVQVDPTGAVQVLRCGGPEIFALRGTADGPDGQTSVVDAGPGEVPLGAVAEVTLPRHLPDDARIAIVTAGYVLAHYDDYSGAVDHALRSDDAELAAVWLLTGPVGEAGGTSLTGPAVVIDSMSGER